MRRNQIEVIEAGTLRELQAVACRLCGGTGNSGLVCHACKGTGAGSGGSGICYVCKGRRFEKCPTCTGTGQVSF